MVRPTKPSSRLTTDGNCSPAFGTAGVHQGAGGVWDAAGPGVAGSARNRFALLRGLALLFIILAALTAPALPGRAAETAEARLSSLQADFFNPNWQRRFPAYESLLELGDAAVPVFVAALSDGDAELRPLAASGLRQLGPAAADAVPMLGQALAGDEDEYVRLHAAWALAAVGPAAVDELIEALRDDDGYTRSAAAWVLYRLGPEAAEAAPDLVRLMEEERPYVRWAVWDALAAIGQGAVAQLRPLLIGPDAQRYDLPTRIAAALIMGDAPSASAEVLGTLILALDDADQVLRRHVLGALHALTLRRYSLGSHYFRVGGLRQHKRALAVEQGREMAEAADRLRRLLDSETDPLARRLAVQILGYLAPEPHTYAAEFVQRLQSEPVGDVRDALLDAALHQVYVEFAMAGDSLVDAIGRAWLGTGDPLWLHIVGTAALERGYPLPAP